MLPGETRVAIATACRHFETRSLMKMHSFLEVLNPKLFSASEGRQHFTSPLCRHSFALRKSGAISVVDWVVAPRGYRSFRVGIEPATKQTHYIYCPRGWSNALATEIMGKRVQRPGPIDEASWNWRDLADCS